MDDQSTQDQTQPDQSQEQPTQDSGLQTPQPDQLVQNERTDDSQAPADAVAQQDESAGEPQAAVDQGQVTDTAHREQELERTRREHAERTGGGEVRENEVQNAHQGHNNRTGGGPIPGADPVDDGPIDRGE